MTELPRCYDVTITVDKDGGSPSNSDLRSVGRPLRALACKLPAPCRATIAHLGIWLPIV